MNVLPPIDLFSQKYDVCSKRDATHEELMKNPKLLKVPDQILYSITNSKEALKHFAVKQGDSSYEIHLNDLLKKIPAYEEWEKAFHIEDNSELSTYQNERSKDTTKLNQEIQAFDYCLTKGQRIFRGCFGNANDMEIKNDTVISTSLFPTVAYWEIVRNSSCDADRIIFDLIVDSQNINIAFFWEKTGIHASEREVLFHEGTVIKLSEMPSVIGSTQTHKGIRYIYYAAGSIYNNAETK